MYDPDQGINADVIFVFVDNDVSIFTLIMSTPASASNSFCKH